MIPKLGTQGGKASYSRSRDDSEIARIAQADHPVCSNSHASQDQVPSRTTDAGSPNSAQTSEFEDAQSGISVTTLLSTTGICIYKKLVF